MTLGHFTKKDNDNSQEKLRIACPIQRLTRSLHLALTCITFTVSKFITFSVKVFTFMVGITFSVNMCYIYFSSDTTSWNRINYEIWLR